MTDAARGAGSPRRIGSYDRGVAGPTLLITGGVHGNEPAGVHAAERVLDALRAQGAALRGRVIALRGNVAALAAGVRFVDRDLNRGWSRDAVAATQARAAADRSAEDAEQLALIEAFEEVCRTAGGPVVYVDLHTSSAEGSPFLCLADTVDNRRLGLMTRVPIILGIEESLAGASLEWFADRGIAGLAVEGGQHESPAAVDNHAAALWELLVGVGMLSADAVDLAAHRARLAAAVGDAPPVVEITHRHAITPADEFRMRPGFVNFAPVREGALLATDCRGELRAPAACHVVLPLYQALGEDGYFLARRVRWFWLWLAAQLRALKLDRLLSALPGVRRAPDDRDTLLADPRVARWWLVEVFHLFGYRRRGVRGARMAFSRRVSRPENRRL